MFTQPLPPPPKKPSYVYAHLHKTTPVFNFQVSPRSRLKHTLTTVHNTSVAVLTRPGNEPGDFATEFRPSAVTIQIPLQWLTGGISRGGGQTSLTLKLTYISCCYEWCCTCTIPDVHASHFTTTFTYDMLKSTAQPSLQLHRFCLQSHFMASEIIMLKKKTSLPCRQVIHERVHFPLTDEIQIHHAEVRSEPSISQITRYQIQNYNTDVFLLFTHIWVSITRTVNTPD